MKTTLASKRAIPIFGEIMQRAILTLLILCLLFFSSTSLQAAPQHLFKIASLAPAGSIWIDQFNNFAKEVEEKTNGEVGFRVYPGGVMGDDQSMYRKMRVGQLNGGGFTMISWCSPSLFFSNPMKKSTTSPKG
jgi:TRAP-type C4-dicarboxylate transport system substrate-binding protein